MASERRLEPSAFSLGKMALAFELIPETTGLTRLQKSGFFLS
jgi:hypothetical protein